MLLRASLPLTCSKKTVGFNPSTTLNKPNSKAEGNQDDASDTKAGDNRDNASDSIDGGNLDDASDSKAGGNLDDASTAELSTHFLYSIVKSYLNNFAIHR
ncbi:unnamed protein product [Citrullus colocynthis]|uniref:Uncharacterized protein n=1 Tax=Citrullus colocynthis TaxID=252529 RepID=A0ABP0XV84_9ROSI